MTTLCGRGYLVSLAMIIVLAFVAGTAVGAAKAVELPAGYEAVHFPSNDAALSGGAPTELTAYLLRPAGSPPYPAIVALHGCGGLVWRDGKLPERERDWAQRLVDAGYAILLVDSFNPRGLASTCRLKDQREFAYRERPRDAYGALLWLQAQPFVQPTRIGLLGWSNGGSSILATLDARPGARPAQLPHGDFRAAIAFYPACTRLERRGGWGTAIPLLVLDGARDDWTPAEPCRRLIASARANGVPAEIVTYPEAYHDFDFPDRPVHTLSGMANARDPQGRVTVGTDPAARADVLRRVPSFFARYLQD